MRRLPHQLALFLGILAALNGLCLILERSDVWIAIYISAVIGHFAFLIGIGLSGSEPPTTRDRYLLFDGMVICLACYLLFADVQPLPLVCALIIDGASATLFFAKSR